MHFVLFAQTTQNRNSVFDRRFFHQDLLEATFQRRILLNALAVLVECRGTDAAQLAAGQHGLEQVRCVHTTVTTLTCHHQVHLINKQNTRSAVVRHLFDLSQHRLDALFIFTLVLGTGHQRTHVERVDLSEKIRRHITVDDALSQTFNHCRLTNTGTTDEYRVVLGASGENSDYSPNLIVTTDDRVQLAFRSKRCKVRAVLVQGIVASLRGLGINMTTAASLVQCILEELLVGKTCVFQHGGDIRVLKQGKQ